MPNEQRPPFVTAALARRKEFSEVSIYHVDDNLCTRITLTAENVRRFGDETLYSTDPKIINDIVTVLSNTAMIESPGTTDARWAVTFRDHAERDRLSLVIDMFGRRAIIEGRAVAIDGSKLVALLSRVMRSAPTTPVQATRSALHGK